MGKAAGLLHPTARPWVSGTALLRGHPRPPAPVEVTQPGQGPAVPAERPACCTPRAAAPRQAWEGGRASEWGRPPLAGHAHSTVALKPGLATLPHCAHRSLARGSLSPFNRCGNRLREDISARPRPGQRRLPTPRGPGAGAGSPRCSWSPPTPWQAWQCAGHRHRRGCERQRRPGPPARTHHGARGHSGRSRGHSLAGLPGPRGVGGQEEPCARPSGRWLASGPPSRAASTSGLELYEKQHRVSCCDTSGPRPLRRAGGRRHVAAAAAGRPTAWRTACSHQRAPAETGGLLLSRALRPVLTVPGGCRQRAAPHCAENQAALGAPAADWLGHTPLVVIPQ